MVQTVRTRGLGYTEKVDVDVVQVTVTVTDGRGHFVKSLPRSVFHVFEDGRPQGITHFASEDIPLELVVAVDISGSMAPAMPKLKKAVKAFLLAVPTQDQVTLDEQPTAAARLFVNGPAHPMVGGAPNGMVS